MIISLWSGPRNISTAMMYSFAQREDMSVVDEPLYGYYLKQSGAGHPGREDIINAMETDPGEVWRTCAGMNATRHVFLKNMGHHAIDLPVEWYEIPVPVFLIRDPRDMLPSLARVLGNPVLRDTGLPRQLEILEKVRAAGHEPVVVEGADILKNPKQKLSQLCEAVGLSFDRKMLRWEPGPIPEDGIWARYWYHQVHESEGFGPWKPGKTSVPEFLEPLLGECLPYYNELKSYK